MPKTGNFMAIKIIGHIFRTYAINKIINICLELGITFNCTDIKIGNRKDEVSTAVI